MNILKLSELYTSEMQILWYLSSISTKKTVTNVFSHRERVWETRVIEEKEERLCKGGQENVAQAVEDKSGDC